MTSDRRAFAGFNLQLWGQPARDDSSEPTPERYGLLTFGDSRPPGDYDIDIVAVHGLGGDRERSWTDKNGKLWLRDFLPSQLPKARIMSYGYNAETVFSNAVTNIRDEATILLDLLRGERRDGRTRPIIFACHSLGGIVVKKALILAHERFGIYGDLLNSVRGCLFFGVPHRGSTSAYWGGLAARITKTLQLGKNTNTNFINALEKNSEFLDETSQQFVERAAQLTIRTFYETNNLSGFLIVDKDSARLNLSNEVAVGIPGANHRTVCKFGDASSQKYLLVKQAIWDLLDPAIIGSGPSTVTPVAVPPATGIQASKPLSSDEIERLLYTSDYDSHYLRVPRPTPGTCLWFLRHDMCRTWSEKQGSGLLWISADPGCGKSVLSSFLVKKLRETDSQAVLPGTVCFFFFKDDNEEQKNAISALRALLHQLFKAKNYLIKHAMSESESKGAVFADELHTLWKIFTNAATDPESGHVLCVLDGLDECEQSTRSILMECLVGFFSDCGDPESEGPDGEKSRLKIIVTSRPYQTIEDGFHDLPESRLKGETETKVINADIENVIRAKVEELGPKRQLPNGLRESLQHKLIERADQTFLWVSLILQLLLDAPEASEDEFSKIIDNLPNDLYAVYDKILGGSRDPTKAKTVLHVVVAAARPLTLDEMNVALAIQPGHKSMEDLKPCLKSSFETTVKELCGLFIRVIDSKIYLVHQTAKEFLIKDPRIKRPSSATREHALHPNSATWRRILRRPTKSNPTAWRRILHPAKPNLITPKRVLHHAESNPPTWRGSLNPVESNFIIANICIWYLLFTDFEANPLDVGSQRWNAGREVDLYTSKHTFLDYAAKHWIVHFREALPNKVPTKEEMDLLLLGLEVCDIGSKRFITWFEVYSIAVNTIGIQHAQGLTQLMVASYLGLEAVINLLLHERKAKLNEQIDEYGGALNMAALGRQRGASQLLLDKGANFYIHGKKIKKLTKVSKRFNIKEPKL